eukprot:8547485-Alexandrium_andersonii.AAC.1
MRGREGFTQGSRTSEMGCSRAGAPQWWFPTSSSQRFFSRSSAESLAGKAGFGVSATCATDSR